MTKSLLSLFTILIAMTCARLASAQTYMVFVHGKGSDLSPGVVDDTARRNYWRRNSTDTTGDFVRYAAPSGVTSLVVGYDGRASFWDPESAGRVATQINNFITQYNIPDRQLIIVSHSMGGLVSRWILNNGVAGSPYYNYRGENYARIVAKTRYLITVATPHLGAEPADAVYGTSDTLCGNFVGWIMGVLGERNRATDYLRRINLEYASASGGWLQDAGRTRTMYTMSTRRWDTGTGTVEDTGLSAVWSCIDNTDDWWDLFDADIPGDGLVTEESGRGRFERTGSTNGLSWSSGQWVQGPRVDWVRISHNHHHVRLDDQSLAFNNLRNGSSGSSWPGSYIGANGRALE